MTTYILRRLLLMIPTLLGITIVVFFVMALAPGGVTEQLELQERGMRPEEKRALRAYYEQRYGLDKPLIVQYLNWLHRISPIGVRYSDEGGSQGFRFKTPDLGRSFVRSQPVVSVVADALPVTLILNLLTIPLAYGVAVTTGIYAGRHRGKFFDVSTGVVFLALWSLPVMWVGVMAIGLFASNDYLPLFPTGGMHSTGAEQMPFLPGRVPDGSWTQGWLLDALWHLILPVICLTYGSFAFLSKLMRASVLENMGADFVRTARAKGVSEHVVLFHHVLRNSLLPLITMAAGILPALLSGSLIVEQIFSLNGMGKLMIDSINRRDREVILAVTLVISIISLLSLIVRDVLYAMADPRVSYE